LGWTTLTGKKIKSPVRVLFMGWPRAKPSSLNPSSPSHIIFFGRA